MRSLLLCLVPPSTIKARKHRLQIFLFLGELVWREPAVAPPPQRRFGADITQQQGKVDRLGREVGRESRSHASPDRITCLSLPALEGDGSGSS